MNGDGVMQGPSVGQAMPSAPSPPGLAERVCNLENRADEKDRQVINAERIMGLLINEVQELRHQVGLPPLSPDYFNS